MKRDNPRNSKVILGWGDYSEEVPYLPLFQTQKT